MRKIPWRASKSYRLSDFSGHIVLIDFYRGYSWPYCMAELGEFVKHYQELQDLDVQVLAISVDPIGKVREARAKLKAPFAMLSDSHDQVMDLYGTRSPIYRNRAGAPINTPTLVLIDKKGTIRWLHRAPVSEVLNGIADCIGGPLTACC